MNESARQARLKVLDMIYKAQSSHIGSNFSCIDIMDAVFEQFDWDKDVFVLSKGWAAASLYYYLWKYGRITEDQLNSYCQPGSKFIGLAEPIVPEIKIAGGSMGLGLPGAVGIAMAKKIKGEEGRVYCLMSDGEIAIGTTWESSRIALHHKLDNLVVLIDKNGFQAMGKTRYVLNVEDEHHSLLEVFYGWNGLIVFDPRNHLANLESLRKQRDRGIPLCIEFNTTKGSGVSFMENNNIWHYKAPNEDEYIKAKEELCQTS